MNNESEQIFILNTASSRPSASTQKPRVAEMPGSSQVNLENVEDFSHVCRICATITEFVIPIFSGEGLQNNLADKIHKHLPIQVRESDVLPRVVCYQCASTLLAWHELEKCARQADTALRARLITSRQEPMLLNIKSSSSVEEESQSKFTMTPYVVRALEPPQYPEPRGQSASAPVREQKPCTYCPTSHDHTVYQEHLITAHSDLLFHCEECDKYIDRKDFMIHMSLHAVQYTTIHAKKERRKKKKKDELDVNQNNTEVDNQTTLQERDDISLKNSKKDNESELNEFSDHSDTEYGFGPLPESVFEAIEDSQGSRPLEEDRSHTPDNERLSDESNKSIQSHGNNNLSNHASILEASNQSHCILPLTLDGNNHSNSTGTSTEQNNSPLVKSGHNMETVPQTTDDSNTSSLVPDTNNLGNGANGSKKDNHRKTRPCPICSKVYTASSSYFYHMKYFHKGSKDHECGICNKKFATKANLTQHNTSIHTEQYEFECKQCEKRFKSKASLYIHEQTHGGKKSWSCNHCHTSFRWRTHLFRHMTRRHSAEKRHVCTTCGRGFSIRCDLLRHARTHSAGNFTCDKCDLKFAQMRYLKAHIIKKHSTNVAKESQ